MSNRETRALLSPNRPSDHPNELATGRRRTPSSSSEAGDEGDEEDGVEEQWTSSSYTTHSSCSTYSRSDSADSFVPEWEESVQPDGSLFYIEYSLVTQQQKPKPDDGNSLGVLSRSDFRRNSSRRSKKTGSKLTRLLMKRSEKQQTASGVNLESSKVKFSEASEGESKDVVVLINPEMKNKFGRRATLSESMLGISVCPFSDGARIMVAGFMPNSYVGKINAKIKVGDWLKSIDDLEIDVNNIDQILLSYEKMQEIKLTLQRISEEEEIEIPSNEIQKVTSLKEIGKYKNILFEESEKPEQARFALLYVTTDDREVVGQPSVGRDVIYCYPEKDLNPLYPLRGMFLTLNSCLKSAFGSEPRASRASYKKIEYFVSYTTCNNDLLLLAFPTENYTMDEVHLRTKEFTTYIEINGPTLSAYFNNQYKQEELNGILDLITEKVNAKKDPEFEEILGLAHYVPLPKEAQLRLDDSLCEMEAQDYREWNDEPLKSHREFFILGSALYFKQYLLASHLPPVDLTEIDVFLKTINIPLWIQTQILCDLVIWREIYPKSVERGLGEGLPKGRWYLAIVARGQSLLAVILEARHSPKKLLNENGNDLEIVPPSLFYIEEIQDTLEHIRCGGIEKLADTWMYSNKRPQCVYPEEKKSSSMKVNDPDEAGSSKKVMTNVLPLKKTEITSILKRKNPPTDNLETNTQAATGDSSVNSWSEEFDEEDDDSDWDGFPESQKSFDTSDMAETLLKEVSDIVPSKLTAGRDNALYHYVQLEFGEGYLLAPPASAHDRLMIEFKRAALMIHKTLQNTTRIRQLVEAGEQLGSYDEAFAETTEQGCLIRIPAEGGKPGVEFWVVGRLFASPLKEVFICHDIDAPQNMIEIAFRLSLGLAG